MFGKKTGPDFPPKSSPKDWEKTRREAIDAEFTEAEAETPQADNDNEGGPEVIITAADRFGGASAAQESEMSENQKRAARGESFRADWAGSSEGSAFSAKEWKDKLAGLVSQVQSFGKKGVEKVKESGKNGGELPGKLSSYLSGQYAKNSEKLSGFFGKGKESTKSNAEKAKAYAQFFKERYKDKDLKEKSKQLGVDILEAGKWYGKLSWKKKLAVAAGFAGASAAISLSGGGFIWLSSILVPAMIGRRALGGLATYTSLEAVLEKRLAAKEEKTGVKRTRLSSVIKHLSAVGAGVLVGEGAVGYAGKEAFEHLGGSEAWQWLASHWPSHAAPAAPPSGNFSTVHQVEVTPRVSINAHAASATPAVESVPTGPLAHASIDTRGEGAGKLFLNLKDNLHSGSSAAYASEDVQRILHGNVQELARNYGLSTMHMGDTLEVNGDGHLVFTPHNGVPRTLVWNNEPQAAGASVAQHAAEHHSSGSHAREKLATRDLNERQVTAALNAEQLQQPDVAQGTMIHDVYGSPAEHAMDTTPHIDTTPTPPVETIPPGPETSADVNPDYHPPVSGSSVETAPDTSTAAHAPTSVEGLAGPLTPYENTLGAHIEPAVEHIYHQPDGTLVAYGGSNMDDLREFAAKYALEHHQSVTVDASYKDFLTGAPITKIVEFKPPEVAGGTVSSIFSEGVDVIVPDPQSFDKLVS